MSAPLLATPYAHPAPRAVHAVNAAHQIALGIRDVPGDDGGSVEDDADRIARLLADVPGDIAALFENNEALQRDLRGLRDQGLEDAQEISRLRFENAGLIREREIVHAGLAQLTGDLAALVRVTAAAVAGVPHSLTLERRSGVAGA
jgi:hypothetical protein